jgi:bacterioferritin
LRREGGVAGAIREDALTDAGYLRMEMLPSLRDSRVGLATASIPTTLPRGDSMAPPSSSKSTDQRRALIDGLNEDLAREYQAIIAYVVYSQVMKGAAYMSIAAELEKHAAEELQHAITIAKQIDYLGGTPTVTPKSVKTAKDAKAMLRFDLENETETVRNYRDRVRQAEALEEFALAEDIREILVQEQEHQIDLATALGIDVPPIGLKGKSQSR